MLNSFKNLMSYGVREWLRPRKLVETVYGCLRIVSEPFVLSNTLENTEYAHNKKESIGTVCIPLSYIHNYSTIAGEGVSLNAIAGSTGDSWRINGLPRGIVLLGKSADSVECMLLGTDFVETAGGYISYKNPAEFGIINYPALGEPTISFFYAGGSTVSADNRFNISYPGVYSVFIKKIIDSIRMSAFGLGLANGKISAIASGRNCVLADRELLRTWSEGGVIVGQTSDMLLYAGDDESLQYAVGDTIPKGCSLTGASAVVDKLHTAPKQQALHSMLDSWTSHVQGSCVHQTVSVKGVSKLGRPELQAGGVSWFLCSPSKENPYTSVYKNEMSASSLAASVRAFGGCIVRDPNNSEIKIIGCTPQAGDYLHAVAVLDPSEEWIVSIKHLETSEMLVANGEITVS